MNISAAAQRSHKATLAGKQELLLAWGIHAQPSQKHQLHIILPPCGGDVGKCQQKLTTAALQLLEQLLGASVDLENIRIILSLLWIIARAKPAGLILHTCPSQTYCQDFLFHNSNPSSHRKKAMRADYLLQKTEPKGCWICPILDLMGSKRKDYPGAATSIFSCYTSRSLANDWQCFIHFNQLLPSFNATCTQILCFCQSNFKCAFQSLSQS